MIRSGERETGQIFRLAATAAALTFAPVLASAPVQAAAEKPYTLPNAELEPTAFGKIPGWKTDDHAAAFATFLNSCKVILRSTEKTRRGRPPLYHALHRTCQRTHEVKAGDGKAARAFFEQNFSALRIAPLGERDGFITGYYEPIVDGARLPSDSYHVPVYRKPDNMLISRLRRSGAVVGKLAWRKKRPKGVTFFDRTQIEEGALAGRGLELVYLKDPIDAFFAQIQGSLRVRLEDGHMMRLNYAGSNGHAYTAVGRFLIERNIVSREEMSMQKIREWMEANPEEGKALRRLNKSFVFFRDTDLKHDEEAIGAQGIPLTTLRSIAVDRKLHVYGTPFFIDALLPIVSDAPETAFRHLMIAQDTGGAIVGPARADLYYGSGQDAERIAGRLKNYGRFYIFVPKELDPAVVAAKVPLPRPKPASPKIAGQPGPRS